MSISIGAVPDVARKASTRERGITYVLAVAHIGETGEIVPPSPNVSRVYSALVTLYPDGSVYVHVGASRRSQATRSGGLRPHEILSDGWQEFCAAVRNEISRRNGETFDVTGLAEVSRPKKSEDTA